MAKKNSVYLTVRFNSRDEDKVYTMPDTFGYDDIDDLMQESFERGWLTFEDDEEVEHYINLDSVEALYFD